MCHVNVEQKIVTIGRQSDNYKLTAAIVKNLHRYDTVYYMDTKFESSETSVYCKRGFSLSP